MLLAAVAVALAAAAITPLIYARWPRIAAAGAVALAVLLALGFAACVPAVARGEAYRDSLAWAPALGVQLAMRLDGLALAFALLITWLGALVLLYSIGYFGHGPRLGRMLALLLLFLGSMLGLVLADDAITLVVFWELTSVTSFYLIAFDDRSAQARQNALQALVITGAGGLVLLVGMLMLMAAGGTASMSALAAGGGLRDHALYPAIVGCVALAAFTKSAQVPFHVWLPNAMVAPTPVSTYLHAATMVKAGVYVLARLSPVLGGTALWTGLLVGVGAVTALTGGGLAILQRDLKRVLAYATISALGTMTVLIGIGSERSLEAFALLLLAHGAYKATLFMVAGNVEHHRGQRNPYALVGLASEMPVTTGAAVLGALSMAGVPPLLGYLAKEATYLGAVTGPWATAVGAAIVVGGLLLVLAAWIVAFEPFFRGPLGSPRWQDAPVTCLVGPAVLAVAGLWALAPGQLERLVAPFVAAVAARPVSVDVALWHGTRGVQGLVLGLSAASLVLGSIGYFIVARRVGGLTHVDTALSRHSMERAYAAVVRVSAAVCTRIAVAIVEAPLRRQVAIIVVFTMFVIGAPLVAGGLAVRVAGEGGVGEIALLVVAGAGAIGAAMAASRMVTIVCLSVTGTAIALVFALLSAPDLAITQVVVETLMVILLVAMFRHLPRSTPHMPGKQRIGAGVVAAGFGVVVALALLAVSAAPDAPRDAANAHVRLAAEEGTDNVITAIIVDHRAMDTLGEITVLATSGIGVFALLRLRPNGRQRA